MQAGHIRTTRIKPHPAINITSSTLCVLLLGYCTRITNTNTTAISCTASRIPGFPDSRRHTSVHPPPFIQVDHRGAVAHAGRGTGAGASVRLPPCKPGGGGRNMGRYVTARDITGSSCVSLHRRQPPEISARLLAYMTSPRQSSRACRCSFATPRSRLASFVRCRRRTPWGGGVDVSLW